jgi:N-acetyl-anhydromuramyl-L-alanine amidase AmpD
MKPKYLTIHCSATPGNSTATIETVRRWHVEDNGWSDIGYHFVIERNGSIEDGRPLTRQGAHTYGHNQDNIGICLMGGVDSQMNPEDNFTDVQWDALRYLISYLSGIYGIKEENIKGHRDWGAKKACPSFDVKSKLEEWKK